MKILALEFSAERRSAAVRVDDAEPLQVQETVSREYAPLRLIDLALRKADLHREQIERVAVGLGPGSYTGIRSSIALAQGWHLASGVPLLGIHGVDALAALAQARGVHGDLAMIVDAQRGEFYLARYRVDPTQIKVQEPLRLVDQHTVSTLIKAGVSVLGTDTKTVAAGATLLTPEASILALLASNRNDCADPAMLEPVYLRESRFAKAPPPRSIPDL